jgi:hypothetical protein
LEQVEEGMVVDMPRPGLRQVLSGTVLKTLPDPDSDDEWPLDKRVKWLQTATNIFNLIYKGEGGIKIEPATAQRSPRPHD